MHWMNVRCRRHCLLDLWSWRGNCLSRSHRIWESALLSPFSVLHALICVTCTFWTDSAPNSPPIFVLVLADAIDSLILMLKLHLVHTHLPCHVGLLHTMFLGSYR